MTADDEIEQSKIKKPIFGNNMELFVSLGESLHIVDFQEMLSPQIVHQFWLCWLILHIKSNLSDEIWTKFNEYGKLPQSLIAKKAFNQFKGEEVLMTDKEDIIEGTNRC